MRALLIGCGKIGSEFADDPRIKGIYTHAGAWRACAGVDLVAVCDNDGARAQRCAERWQVGACYDDPVAALEKVRPDLVSVCTPDATHFALLEQVLATPGVRGVLAEKPLATDLAQACRIVDQAAAKGIALAVNYSRRYSRGHQALRERLRRGDLGDIQRVAGAYTKGTLHNGTHWFDLARFLIGDVAAVWAHGTLPAAGGEPTLDVGLRFAGGSSGHLAGLDANAYSLFEMDILGTQGRVRIVDHGHALEWTRVGDSPYYSGYRTLLADKREDGELEDTLLHAAQDLVAAIEEQRPPRCSGEDACAALAIGLAAMASAASGGAEQVPVKCAQHR